jgi:hypothetical protein
MLAVAMLLAGGTTALFSGLTKGTPPATATACIALGVLVYVMAIGFLLSGLGILPEKRHGNDGKTKMQGSDVDRHDPGQRPR